jgi:hypothetical protein
MITLPERIMVMHIHLSGRPKLKIFMWITTQKSILTKDNMIKPNWWWWGGGLGCYFCNVAEIVDVVFLVNSTSLI